MSKLTHLNPDGAAIMVDISAKAITARSAKAAATIHCSAALIAQLQDNTNPKGDVLATARIAGIQAAKKCADLIPLCHPLPLAKVSIDLQIHTTQIDIIATCKTDGKTGVEMEALTAASVAALTIYDMGKAIDKSMVIDNIHLLEKSGGQSGDYKAPQNPATEQC